MSERPPFQHYLDRMAALGFQPSSVRGQNFLLDPTLHRWLAEQSGAGPTDTVVEVGVGLGFLTRELASRAGKVVGVEIDDRLFRLAGEDLAGLPNVELVHGDVLGGPGGSLHPAIGAAALAAAGRFLFVANLPYAVAGPLLAELQGLPVLPARAVLLVQKELAQRVQAPPGHADFGNLSALVQSLYTARLLRSVPPEVFRPRPKVVSAVLGLELRADRPPELATPAARREFAAFLRTLFQQRRKVLRTTLATAAAAIGGAVPPGLGPQLGGRAEQLGPAELLALWRACRPAAPAGS